MGVTGSQWVAGEQGHACAAELLFMSHRRVLCCNQLLLKTAWSLAALRMPYSNTPMVNIYIQ